MELSNRIRRMSLHKNLLIRKAAKMDMEGTFEKHLQRFIFLLDKYCVNRFRGSPIPSPITSFKDDLLQINPVPARKFDFSSSVFRNEAEIVSEMEQIHMWFFRRNYLEFEGVAKEFASIIPWQDSETSSSHPTTPTSSLSALSPESSVTYEGNGFDGGAPVDILPADIGPDADPVDPPVADPADPPVADPADPPVADPADPPVADPADPPVADPADPPVADPADPPVATV